MLGVQPASLLTGIDQDLLVGMLEQGTVPGVKNRDGEWMLDYETVKEMLDPEYASITKELEEIQLHPERGTKISDGQVH